VSHAGDRELPSISFITGGACLAASEIDEAAVNEKDLLTRHCRVGEEASWFLKAGCVAAFASITSSGQAGFSTTHEKAPRGGCEGLGRSEGQGGNMGLRVRLMRSATLRSTDKPSFTVEPQPPPGTRSGAAEAPRQSRR